MRLKIRYEQEFQTIELDAEATEQLWVSLSLEGEGLSQEEREQRIQDAFDEQYNRPEYNIWHRETRHIDPTPKRKRMDGRRGYIQADPDDAAFDIMDYLLTTTDAEMHIAVRLDGETVREYAARIGADENNITQKLKRAAQKLKENYKDRQI